MLNTKKHEIFIKAYYKILLDGDSGKETEGSTCSAQSLFVSERASVYS
jgi:hypothetical protein